MITYKGKPISIVHVNKRAVPYSPAVETPQEVEIQFLQPDGTPYPEQYVRHCIVLATELTGTEEGELELALDTADTVTDRQGITRRKVMR